MSVAILGGSSAFTPALAQALADLAGELPDLEIRLQGLNEGRLDALARFCNKHSALRSVPHTYVGMTSVREAAAGCPVVINKMRVGGFAGRTDDERLALRHGVPGDETIGPAGLASAIRSLPTVAASARAVLEVAPKVWFVNLSNPMDILLTDLKRIPGLRCFGICELPRVTLRDALNLAGAPKAGVHADYVGVNHQGWFVSIRTGGEEILGRIIAGLRTCNEGGSAGVDPRVMEEIGALPLPYMRLYYHREREVRRQEGRGRSRGQELACLAARLQAHYASGRGSGLPPELSSRHMPWVQDEARLLCALLGGPEAELYVSMRNGGVYPFLPDDAIVEQVAHVTALGPRPLGVRTHPKAPEMKLLTRIVHYEEMAAKAARNPGEDLIKETLHLHPFNLESSIIQSLTQDLLMTREQGRFDAV